MKDPVLDQANLNFSDLEKILTSAPTEQDLHMAIVNTPFDFRVATAFLFLGIIVLLKVNKKTGTIDRIALSQTELAKNTTDVSVVPFSAIKIPLDHQENIIATAIRTGKPQDTIDWKFLFEPALTPDQARLNQASGGIAYSAVYPLKGFGDGGAMIFSYFQYMHNIGNAQHEFMDQYSSLVARILSKH